MGLRVERLGGYIKEEVALILQREIADPRLTFVSVTRVALSKDLRQATVFVSVLDDAHRELAMQALERARGHIQSLLAPRIRARFLPHITFQYDPGLARAVAVSKLIDDAIKEDRARAAARGEAPAAEPPVPRPKPPSRRAAKAAARPPAATAGTPAAPAPAPPPPAKRPAAPAAPPRRPSSEEE
jgi:ribosome-binding factor A